MLQVIKRLELIKNSISLEDEEIIDLQVAKLQQMQLDEPVRAIVSAIRRREFSSVIPAIDEYIGRFNGLIVFEDGEISGLKLELKLLERELEELTDQKNDLQFMLDQFNLRYQLEMGGLIRNILEIHQAIQLEKIKQKQQFYKYQKAAYDKLKEEVASIKQHKVELEKELEQCYEFSDEYDRIVKDIHQIEDKLREYEEQLYQYRQVVKEAKEKLEGTPEFEAYQEARQDYEEFDQYNKAIMPDDCVVLDESEERQLKDAYKKAARLCHPDLVEDTLKEQATRIMQELNASRKKQDLPAVLAILQKLESELMFEVTSNSIDDKTRLIARIDQLHLSIDQIKHTIAEIQSNEAWQELTEIEDMSVYFTNMKDRLSSEYASLQSQLDQIKHNAETIEEEALIDLANKEIDDALMSERGNTEMNPDELNEYFSKLIQDDEDDYWREQF